MFSVKRFDAFESTPSDAADSSAKLDALNEKILKKRKLVGDAAPSPSSTPSPSKAPAATPAPTKLAPSLNIHPSRLNAAPLLRQSVNKARTGPKEKTKAKTRYLKAKKDRRKARIKAAPKKGKKDGDADAGDDISETLPEEQSLDKLIAERQAKLASKQSEDASNADASDSDVSSSEVDSTISSDHSEPAEKAPSASDEAETPGDEAAVPENEEELVESKGLRLFPAAGVKPAVDPKLVGSLGLPEGLSNRTVVNPTLSRPLQQENGVRSSTEEDGSGEPSDDFAKVAISDSVRQRLEALGVTEWFAVQVTVIPYLLAQPRSRMLYRPFAPPRDLCVSAPTGSGKTLAYTVPIVEVLRIRQIVRLRALIVLPTRDLVSQVRSTLELIAKGTGLRVATATGAHSFAHEQSQICEGKSAPQVDILIATPGRLIDHLDSTPGFTLTHLRFLVIDEADRLLNQSFQQWLRRVLAAVEIKSASPAREGEDIKAEAPFQLYSGELSTVPLIAQEEAAPSVQKLLFSATLTRDPAKIAELGLRNPHYITVQDNDAETGIVNHEHFALPHSLHEHMLVTTSEEKPLHLLHLLHRAESPVRQALCFTKSVESAARLVKLVELFEDVRAENAATTKTGEHRRLVVQNYSSELRPSERQRILAQATKGEIDVLVLFPCAHQDSVH